MSFKDVKFNNKMILGICRVGAKLKLEIIPSVSITKYNKSMKLGYKFYLKDYELWLEPLYYSSLNDTAFDQTFKIKRIHAIDFTNEKYRFYKDFLLPKWNNYAVYSSSFGSMDL